MSQTQTQTQPLTQDQALSVLIQAARVAQSKGAFTLEDAKIIADAVAVFAPPAPEKEAEATEEATAETSAQ
jgi:hypothetical protein